MAPGVLLPVSTGNDEKRAKLKLNIIGTPSTLFYKAPFDSDVHH